MRTTPHRGLGGRPGFTLVEILVGLTLIALMLTLGLPALQHMIQRSKLEAVARQMAVTMQAARYEAIKRSISTIYRVDTASGEMLSFVDQLEVADGGVDGELDEGEPELTYSRLPTGIDFAAPGGQAVVDGLNVDGDGAWIVFDPDGSSDLDGGLRLGNGRGDFMEVRLALAATGRVEINLWEDGAWREL